MSAHCWVASSLSSTSTLKSFSAGLLNLSMPQPVLIWGIALIQVQPLALSLANPLKLVQIPLDGILSFRCVNHITHMESPTSLLRLPLSPWSMSLIKTLNYTGPSKNSSETLLVTDVYWSTEALTTTHWMCLSNQLIMD